MGKEGACFAWVFYPSEKNSRQIAVLEHVVIGKDCSVAATCSYLLNLLNLGQFTAGGTELNNIGLAATRGIEGENLAGASGRLHTGESVA